MSEIAVVHNTGLAEAGVLRRTGAGVFAFAMVTLGVETLICARDVAQVLGPQPCGRLRSPWAACCLSARSFSTFRKTRRMQAASPCARECLSRSRSHAWRGPCRLEDDATDPCAREPLSPRAFPHRVRSGPFPCSGVHHHAVTGLDSMGTCFGSRSSERHSLLPD